MQQIETYLKGERNYYNIEGDTGPLVYPGLHVYIYRVLYTLTGQGKNILIGQIIFALLYLSTLALVMTCYRKAKVSAQTNGHGQCRMLIHERFHHMSFRCWYYPREYTVCICCDCSMTASPSSSCGSPSTSTKSGTGTWAQQF